jgi:UDP-N-acetylmuramyl pentapeptide synthase
VERVTDSLVDGAWVVVKGSRGMTMEKVVTGILESIAAQGAGGRD